MINATCAPASPEDEVPMKLQATTSILSRKNNTVTGDGLTKRFLMRCPLQGRTAPPSKSSAEVLPAGPVSQSAGQCRGLTNMTERPASLLYDIGNFLRLHTQSTLPSRKTGAIDAYTSQKKAASCNDQSWTSPPCPVEPGMALRVPDAKCATANESVRMAGLSGKKGPSWIAGSFFSNGGRYFLAEPNNGYRKVERDRQ